MPTESGGGPVSRGAVVFAVARDPVVLEQVYGLNYRTFVEEIPQHRPRAERRLVDSLLAESTCLVALDGETLVGMVAISGRRPFSLDRKLPDLDRYLPPGLRPCEIRLLAVERHRRGGAIFAGLLRELVRHSAAAGYDVAVISGTERQLRLYRHMGFRPFGPRLGTPEAPFQGMMLTWDRLRGAELRVLGDLLDGGPKSSGASP